jgi:hypothetical protein
LARRGASVLSGHIWGNFVITMRRRRAARRPRSRGRSRRRAGRYRRAWSGPAARRGAPGRAESASGLRASSSPLITCHFLRASSEIFACSSSGIASGSWESAAAVEEVYCCGWRLPAWRASKRGRSRATRGHPNFVPGCTNRGGARLECPTSAAATTPNAANLRAFMRASFLAGSLPAMRRRSCPATTQECRAGHWTGKLECGRDLP